MPLKIIRNDLTKVVADAIVLAANATLTDDGGGVGGAIHRAAGPELLEECRAIGGCEVGQAQITKGYGLPAKYIIHTVGPVWQDGLKNEEQQLAACYRSSLALAQANSLESIAFPLISSGAYGFPKDRALYIATSVIGEFLLEHEMTVYLVVYDEASFRLSEKLYSSISQYIDDHYVDEQGKYQVSRFVAREELVIYEQDAGDFLEEASAALPVPSKKKRSLEELVNQMDETFSQMLLRLIDEKGLTDAATYKKANMDRKLFSKIRNDINYKPSKVTVLAFAIALELNLDETKDLLLRAGFALSHSSKFDIIIRYFIEERNYNVYEINEALFAFEQNLLGI